MNKNAEEYKKRWIHCLDAIEYTISLHGNDDWLRDWVEGNETAENDLQAWIANGKPK